VALEQAAAAKIIIMVIPYTINTTHVKRKNKSGNSNKRGNWNHLKITQTIPEQHTGKALYQECPENSHTGHCEHTSESTNVTVQNVGHEK